MSAFSVDYIAIFENNHKTGVILQKPLILESDSPKVAANSGHNSFSAKQTAADVITTKHEGR